jgi:preprotein translocase subunit YajC
MFMDKFVICLVISILGIFILLLIISNLQPKKISNYSELAEGDYVHVTGKIISLKNYQDFSLIKLDNNITITCNCKFRVNSTIKVIGKVELYQNNLQISADKIEIN